MGKWTRRGFITAGVLTGGGMILGVGLGVAVRPGHRAPKLAPLVAKDDEVLVNAWVKILPDNTVTAIVPHCEMGQGVHTSLPMMLADEMDADWGKVTMEQAPAHEEYANFHMARSHLFPGKVPGLVQDTLDGAFLKLTQSLSLQTTGGSFSVRATGTLGMRVAGAAAREMLIGAAARQWGVATTELRAENSHIYHDASGRVEPFIIFAAAAAEKKPPSQPKLKEPSQFKLMGRNIARIDIPAKVNGTAGFGIDVDLPGMKYATVKAAPVFGSKVVSIDSKEAEKLPGIIKVVNLEDSVGVIAEGYWQAKKALDKITVKYSPSDAYSLDQESMFERFGQDMDKATANQEEKVDFTTGDSRAVLAAAETVIEAEYRVPFLAHATMEPMNCTAWMHDDQLEFWAGMQNPLGTRNAVADELNLQKHQVTAHNVYLGGGFGRRARPDYPLQAAKLAKALPGVPIKMIWSREEDTQQDFYRQAVMSRFKASLAPSGLPEAWENQFVDKHEPVEAPYIPYAINNQYIHYTDSPTHVRFGAWRSVDHSHHGFFTESFIDELAFTAKVDPYEYRRKLLVNEPRLMKVLEKAAEISRWGRKLPKGWGQGIALQQSFGTLVAQVVEVDMTQGSPRVDRVFCAVDPGFAVNPDGMIAQMESGIIFGLTAALYGEISLDKGAVVQSNFHDYPMVRMNTAPKITVSIINSMETIGGAGEPGTPAVAPALTNAIFAATGKRIRELPVSKFDNRYDIKTSS
jgi:isoquinoline 1-oxidoreductase beta subunit